MLIYQPFLTTWKKCQGGWGNTSWELALPAGVAVYQPIGQVGLWPRLSSGAASMTRVLKTQLRIRRAQGMLQEGFTNGFGPNVGSILKVFGGAKSM